MDAEVVIIGGGIVGICTALAFKARGLDVLVVDAEDLSKQSASGNRAYAINHSSISLLDSLGVWGNILKSEISPYEKMFVWDDKGRGEITFDCTMVGLEKLGAIVLEASLKKSLFLSLKQNQIAYADKQSVENIRFVQGFPLIKTNKQEIRAKFMVVCDGARSNTRDLLKIKTNVNPYGDNAIVATVSTTIRHNKTAYQVFTEHGPLAFLPLKNENMCSIVWSTRTDISEKLMGQSDEEFVDSLKCAFMNKLGECTLETKRFSFPLFKRHVTTYGGENFILLGDCAHTVHPLAGLGLNLGLADLLSFLSLLDKNNLKFTPKVIGAYSRERKYENGKVLLMLDFIRQLFGNNLIPIVGLRSMGLNLCDSILPLKRFFIDQATGISA